MSSASNPICPVTLFTPDGGGGHHDVAHPMTQLPAGQTEPFTLLKNTPPPEHTFSVQFDNQLTAGPGIQNARAYLAAFTTSVSSPAWTGTLSVPTGETQGISFTRADLNGGTDMWMGTWWDDGTYPATEQGVIAYFEAHPNGGMHHTVPIRIG